LNELLVIVRKIRWQLGTSQDLKKLRNLGFGGQRLQMSSLEQLG